MHSLLFLSNNDNNQNNPNMYDREHGLYIAHCEAGALSIIGKMANRHGLIAGATGTGKTVTLQVMAESFCQAGVPCFMADMKGDLSGISQVGQMSKFIEKRLPEFGIENPQFQSCPCVSSMSMANRDIPCAPPSHRWDLNSFHVCSSSMRRRTVC